MDSNKVRELSLKINIKKKEQTRQKGAADIGPWSQQVAGVVDQVRKAEQNIRCDFDLSNPQACGRPRK